MQIFKTSKARENILARVRNGLGEQPVPMPFPEAEGDTTSQIYANSEVSPEETFANEFIKLGGKFVFCENEKELMEQINDLYDSRGWTSMLCAEERLLQLFQNNKINIVHTAAQPEKDADACITGCEMLIARTGSVLFSSRQFMGRTAPVFYPIHIIVAYANQIASDIDQGITFIKKHYKNGLPSMINLNTGPSRTADIEKTLVVGVHGPGEVFCFYVNA